ncbi:hypothetical protein [Bacillus pumilus]|uniref:hypothetical protein n=1 Tax=Bacillus pumilus TaxID=1408 RepID=UPI0016430D39|nr:hypothetical protein [Bacillus pumilus]
MADETVIARFAQKPSARTAFLGATVGSYGSARFLLEKVVLYVLMVCLLTIILL